MQVATLICAIAALLLAFYAAFLVDHLPTHVYENTRINQNEKWIRSRCAGDTPQKSCLALELIKPPTPSQIFKIP